MSSMTAPARRRFLAPVLAALLALPAAAPVLWAQRPAASAATARPETRARHGMVVSASAIASRVGRDVLRDGGNAVDAAIATAFALAVTYPTAGNIGGGGFMVIRFPDGRATTLDFREKAPLAASPEMFEDSTGAYSATIHHDSYRAVGVPGTVAGLALAHGKYGSLPWRRLVQPAVTLAADGFDVPPGLARSLAGVLPDMKPFPASVAAYSKNGAPYAAGERFQQPQLARTLGRIRDEGRDGFYEGETARLIAEEMRRGGGLITEEDLARYEAKEREPVRGTYRGYEVISMPPPSSGGVAVLEMLNILEGYDLKAMGHDSPAYVHTLVEAMRRAFLDRARYLADPDFEQVPVERLTNKAYAAELRKTILPDKASVSEPAQVAEAAESPETTHFSVVDGNGTAVSVTYTLEQGYGVKIVVPGAGFLLNNEMGDFNGKPGVTDSTGLIGTPANLARPQKRMLSSMTPSILARDGKLVAVVGSPGGRTIINTVLQVILNLVDFDMGIQQAVDAPRLHHQWLPDRVNVEQDGLPPATVAALKAMGYQVRLGGRQGTAHSILIDPVNGDRIGAADPRDRDAGAVGW
ncbi:MAG TPA: gamma-glutamyltransferase [Longimicrobiales bacterium]|nr:gamma-glutamyltransferase [Longimicrobiales bacterium]